MNKKYIGLIIYIITFFISSKIGIFILDLDMKLDPDAPEHSKIFLFFAIIFMNHILHIILFSIYSIYVIWRNNDPILLKIYDNFRIPFIILCCLFVIDVLDYEITGRSWDAFFFVFSLGIKFLFPIYFISLINATRVSKNKILSLLKVPIYIILFSLFWYYSGMRMFLGIILTPYIE